MNDIKLKPCPFCGGKALSRIRIMRNDLVDYAQLQIYCSKCNIDRAKSIDSNCTLDNLQTVMNELIDSWNTRRIVKDE